MSDGTVARSRFSERGPVRLHYLRSDPPAPDPSRAPVLFVPGLSDWATDYDWLLDAWSDRTTVIVDLRGRGLSEAPASGYTIEDHVGDIDTLVAENGLEHFHLVTFSRGSCYAIAWALAHPDSLCSFAIGDYRAMQIRLPPEFPAWWMTSRWRGRPMTEIMAPHVIEGIQRDSREILFWDQMGSLPSPMLIVWAGNGLLDDADMARWAAAVPGISTERFEESPHDLFRPDRFRFARVVGGFLERHDPVPAID